MRVWLPLAAALAGGLWAAGAQADTLTWTNAAGGDFQTAGNWSPNAVPGPTDVAIFTNLAGPYTVTWSANVTNLSVQVPAGTVTWNLQGRTYSLDSYSTNFVGTATTTADLTITNGVVVDKINATYDASGKKGKFKLQGTDTTLRLLAGGVYSNMYYPYLYSGTYIIVNGANAKLSTGGSAEYLTCKCTLVVTNGGYVYAWDGLPLNPGIASFFGPGILGKIGSLCKYAGATGYIDNAQVDTPLGNQTLAGTLILANEGKYLSTGYTTYSLLITGTLQGVGTVGYKTHDLQNGTIRPGGDNKAGLLAFQGNFTNSTGTGSIKLELGGTTANDYDRLTFAAGYGGAGTIYANGTTLDITLIAGFVPGKNTFDILDFVAISGTFAAVNLPTLPGNWDTSKLYTTGELSFEPLTSNGAAILIR